MNIKNKEVLQSYILTTAKYDYSVYEKRILYRIIELNQSLIESKKLNQNYSIEKDIYDDVKYTLPISSFLNGEEDKNHTRIKNALKSLQRKVISYEDENEYKSDGIIFKVRINKYSHSVSFFITEWIYQTLMDFSKGYRKYELATAMKFESVYSMRFYELFSNQKTPINYSIESLKEIFGLENKYKLTTNFINKVIIPAKKELDKCSPYTFHYDLIKTGRKITGIRFIPIHQPQFEDENIKKQKVLKQMSNRWFIPKNIEDYLKHNFEFTEKELKNNLSLFENLYNHLSEDELLDFLVELRPLVTYVDNPKGYLIGALKKKIEQLVEDNFFKKRNDIIT